METRKGLPRESTRVEAWHAAVGADKQREDVCEMQADSAKLTLRGLPRYLTKPSRVYRPLSSTGQRTVLRFVPWSHCL